MSTLFAIKYKRNPDWTVVEGIPDTDNARKVLMAVGAFLSDAYNIQPRLGEPVLDAAFQNLHIPEGTEEEA